MLLTVSCSEDSSTQIVVLMDTDYAVPAEVDRLRARVFKMAEAAQGDAEVETWAHIFPLSDGESPVATANGLPATFSVLPDGIDLEREVVIELEALAAGTGEVLISRRLRTKFIAGQARLVRMLLFRACADQTCAAGQSCGCADAAACTAPGCFDESVDPYDLEIIGNTAVLPGDAGIPDDAGTISCEAPLLLCGSECVNADSDPRYCGDCDTSCPTGFVCESGQCANPGDCRNNTTACSGFTYCDQETGQCLPGCADAMQCGGEHEVCNSATHECDCTPDFERCDGSCVDLQNDPDYCGECARSCVLGDDCVEGMCRDPGDCRVNDIGCSGFTFCDQASGECLRGCEDDDQCLGDNEFCDTEVHDCDCVPTFHRCGPVCVSNADVNSCGDLCTPCLAPPNATPVCTVQICDFQCDDDYEQCDDMCCPTSCPPGEALYAGSCAKIHLQIANKVGNVGEFSSIALDENGRAFLAAYASSGRNLLVSEQQSDATWVASIPDGADDVGTHASIALDANGVVHVAYYHANLKILMLASAKVGGGWAVEAVDEQSDVGEFASLAFDAAGNAHVSYYDAGNKSLLYATRQVGEPWTYDIVDAEDVGQYTSLALGPSGRPHISYYDADEKNLKLASREIDGTWRVRTIASAGNGGKFSSLAFDTRGFAHISYYDESSRDLMYASENFLGFWTFQTVENLPRVGKYSSLAFDAQGVAWVSYYDETSGDLKIARRTSTNAWSIEIVDSDGDVGQYSSLAVDSLGQAHIAYYDLTNTNLKYALVAAPAASP